MCQVGWRTTFADRRQLRAPELNGAIRPGQWPCEWCPSWACSAACRLAIGTVADGRSSMDCAVGGLSRPSPYVQDTYESWSKRPCHGWSWTSQKAPSGSAHSHMSPECARHLWHEMARRVRERQGPIACGRLRRRFFFEPGVNQMYTNYSHNEPAEVFLNARRLEVVGIKC